MVSFSLIGSVIVIWLSRTKHTTGLPWVLKKPLTGTVGRVLGLSTYLAQVMRINVSNNLVLIFLFLSPV